MTDPSGQSIGLPIEFLKKTPFDNFLIPGIILFFANGVLSLVTAILVIKKIKDYPWLIIFQGLILSGWLTMQLIFNFAFFYPVMHLTCYAVGLMLILIGNQLRLYESDFN